MKTKNMTILIMIIAFLPINYHFLLSQTKPIVEKELTETSTLNDYLAYAALNNPGLKAAFNRWKAALERIPQVRSLPDPRFTFAYFIREVETRVGPQQQKVGIMQMFPWFGKLKLQGNAAAEMASAVKQEYENIKLKLFYRVKNAYYDYYYVIRAISVIKENVQLLEYLESVLRTKYRTGQATHADLIKVQVELDKLQDWLKSTEEMVRPVTAQLNAALNRPGREPLPLPGKIPENIASPDYSQLVNWLKINNPELKVSDYLAAKEKIAIKLAKKGYLPDFSLGLDYILTGNALMPGVMDSGKDPLAAMVTINLPIHFKKTKASIREARASLNSVLYEKEEKENNLLARLEMIYYQFRDSGRKLALYRDALIPRGKQALEVAQAAYEAGKVDFLNLIDAQRTLLSFELAYEQALTTHAQRLAELEMVVGKEF